MGNMDQRQDHEVINQVLVGDHQAYRILVDRYKHMVFTLAIRLVQNRQDAEEVAQDAFIKAYRGLAAFKGSSKFSTWIYKITYRAGLDYLKKRKREPFTTPVDDERLGVKSHVDPASPLESRERSAIIKGAVEELPGDLGSLVLLYYYEELSLREIAEVTGKKENAIKVGLHRARKRLAASLPEALGLKSIGYADSR